MDLEDTHPLRERAHIQDIYPMLSRCYKRRKVHFIDELRHVMMHEAGLTDHEEGSERKHAEKE